MELKRWSTPVSDCRALYFQQLVDDGEGRFIVESESGETFEVVTGSDCGPYSVTSEEFLTKYWSIKPEKVGWTFMVISSDFVSQFPGIMEPSDYHHYVVSTLDTCLEVLSKEEPVVRKINIY